MKNSGVTIVLLCSLAAHAQPRDPFLAPVDKCPQSQWDNWRFHGAVSGGSTTRAIVESPQGKWFRVSPGQPLTEELRVQGITADVITIVLPSACGQSEIHWQRKEKFHDKNMQIHRAAVPAKRAGRHAGK